MSDSERSRSFRTESDGSGSEGFSSSWSVLSEREASDHGNNGPVEPIAIIGMSCRLGGSATDTSNLWDMLVSRRTAWTPGPGKRFNMAAFQDPTSHRSGTTNTGGGHFLKEDVAAFDAAFFGINPMEAKAMDPQHRLLLEIAYECFQNAGITPDSLWGSNTGVYVGQWSTDYHEIEARDVDNPPLYLVTGTGPAIASNRVSYTFNLRGPSFTVDTGCSSSLVALHQAVQSLRAGETKQCFVGGVNLLLDPQRFVYQSRLKMFSKEGRSFAFDDRANGYGRGEGCTGVLLKPLSAALRDGDHIRAVIRNSVLNQDGRTPGISVPSAVAQKEAIRRAYRQAKLALRADYVEAHGTGTKVGDPIEARAIAEAFTQGRPVGYQLPIGSIKANIGHTEGAAGLAGLIKTVLMLEHGVIPPQANYETPNPDILLDKWKLRIPTKLEKQSLRRISVNSFGYGGTNAHVVVDSTASVLTSFSSRLRHHPSGLRLLAPTPRMPRVFFISAASEKSCQRMCRRLARYLVVTQRRSPDPDAVLARLAYTLDKQAVHPFRLSLVATEIDDLIKQLVAAASLSAIPRRDKGDKARIAFVFSGQGAQYAEMARELLGSYPPFLRSLERARQLLLHLGCQWDLLSELCRPKAESRINNPGVSQPASTAVQLALVDLLNEFGIMPDAVVGHSSGEIAAAYACGAISFEGGMTAAYFRGKLTDHLISGKPDTPGAMLAVGADPDHVRKHIDNVGEEHGRLRIACFNSPSSVTVSGDAPAIDELKAVLDLDGTFNRKLMTNGAAYHSHQMRLIEEEYAASLKGITFSCLSPSVRMFSSVTGEEVDNEISLDGRYWARNLVSPVLFSHALGKLCDQEYRGEAINTIVEVGPHSQLGGPVNQILKAKKKGGQVSYVSTLKRGKPADISLLECMGFLHAQTGSMPLRDLNKVRKDGVTPGLLVDLPPYPFDHERSFWHETRISKDYRHRKHIPHNLLGTLAPDVNRLEPRWRRFLSLKELPWLRGHAVQGQVLFPAAGYLTMAVQAARQHVCMTSPNVRVESVLLRNISIGKGLVLSEDAPDVEIQLALRPEARTARESSTVWTEFRIFTVTADGKWTEHCRGALQAETEPVQREDAAPSLEELARIEAKCTRETAPRKFYNLSRRAGLDYQGAFENVASFRASSDAAVAVASEPATEMTPGGMGDFLHPAALDSALFHGLCCILFVERGAKTAHVPTFIQQLRVFDRTSRAGSEFVATSVAAPGEGTVFDVTVHGNGSDDDSLVLAAHGVRTTALPSNEVLDRADEEMCHRIEWVTYVDAWTAKHRDQVCSSTINKGSSVAVNEYLDAATLHYVAKAVKDVASTDIPKGHRQHLFAWMQMVTAGLSQTPALPEPPSDVDAGAWGEAVHRLGTHLAEILTGKTEALALLTPDNLLTRMYQVERLNRCVAQMAEYCHELGRQSARLRVLEVGAGTASATVPVLEALAGRGHRYVEKYHFTDLSPAFFQAAKDRLGDLADVVEFKPFDLERSAADQGFEEGSFDLVIASNVVHACPSVDGVLANLHPLLKPGGRFMLMELTRETVHYNLLFGVFEGWWAGFDEGRTLSPLLTPSAWTSRLQGAGFCDAEPVFHDYAEEDGGCLSVFVARKPLESASVKLPPVHLVVENAERAGSVQSQVTTLQGRVPGSRISAHPLSTKSPGANVAVIMPEVARLLSELTDPTIWGHFRDWAMSALVLILVGATSRTASAEAITGIWPGFVRCLRRERPDIRLITFDIDTGDEQVPDKLVEVLPTLLQSPSLDLSLAEEEVENEFAEKDGQLFVSRAFHLPEMSQYVHSSRDRAEPQLAPFLDPARVLTAELATPGLMETLRWKDDTQAPAMGPDDIKFELRAASINFKDVLIAAGQLDGITEMRNDCSGVVLEVGENVRDRFKPGDRVCALYSRSYTNYPVVAADCCAVVPDTMSFEEAAALPIVWCTAYHSLIDKGNLSRGETVLIHSAAGAVGQAAIILAQHVGAEVFVTVSSDAKREFLHERYGVPRDHMFSSRNTSFYSGIKRMTKGRGVDVVLNSLSGEMFRQSCNLMAPFGRFVEIGRKDLMDDALMPMSFLLRNVTLSYVELSLIINDCKPLAKRILDDVVGLAASGVIRPVSIESMPISRIEEAFRLIQAGKHVGKIVLSVEEGQKVKASPPAPPPARLCADATYAIVGGFGGLGRSMVAWMADHGAKYILCLSRSGPTGDGVDFIEEMDARGVTVVAPKCDVASQEQVSGLVAYTEQQGLPPIRGIIQSAMVIKDSVFEDMTEDQWRAALAPKVAGTRNLHATFGINVDFFVTLSSVVSLRGNMGQSNYAGACSYQDALARRRASLGLPAFSIDVGPILEVGFVSENPEVEAALQQQGIGTIGVEDFLALLNYAVTHPLNRPEDSVCAIGMLAGARGAEENTNMGWKLFSHARSRDAVRGQMASDGPVDSARRLDGATQFDDAVEIVCDGILQQLSKLIATPVEALSASQSLDSYGVDSLVAVELRNWIGAHLQASVPLMVLRGTGSIVELAKIVAKESRLVSCKDK